MAIADANLSLRDWLSRAAAKQPTPGGGSVTALVGALAAAMGEMTLNYSTGRKANSPEAENAIRENLAELGRARKLLLELIQEDQQAYLALTEARKLDDTCMSRSIRILSATTTAIAVPRAIMAAGMSVLACASRVAEHANKHLLSDLAVCCELALATIRCAGHNVRTNLADLSDEEGHRLSQEVDATTARGVELLRSTLAVIAKRSSL